MDWAKLSGHINGIVLHSFTSSEDLLEAWHHGMMVDAFFLDIQIPGELSGLAVAKEIHSVSEYLPIVFITNFGEYAEEGYKVNALRYLHKPVTQKAVSECMDILWKRWAVQNIDSILIETSSRILRLPINTIIYVEVFGHYCILHTTDNCQTYRVKKSLDVFRKKLPSRLFVQCHRSFIVNILYIRNISNGGITMSNGVVLQMSRNYQSQLIHQFRQYFLGGTSEC